MQYKKATEQYANENLLQLFRTAKRNNKIIEMAQFFSGIEGEILFYSMILIFLHFKLIGQVLFQFCDGENTISDFL